MPLPHERADVHAEPWYWRLLNYFGRIGHPVTGEDVEADEQENNDQFSKWFNEQLTLSNDRITRYSIFYQMDATDLIAAFMDVYAEEVTQLDYEKQRTVWIESKHSQMIRAGDTCLQNIMIEDRITALARRTALLGDNFRRLIYATGKGVLGWKFAPPEKTHRIEDKYDRLVGFREDGRQFRGPRKHSVSWPWDYVHFRLLGREDDTVYGSSAAAPMFRPWRQLCLCSKSLIWTADGPKRIEDVQPGDITYCHDYVTGANRKTKVVAVSPMGVQSTVTIHTPGHCITATPNHGMLVRTAGGEMLYKEAAKIICDGTEHDSADSLVVPLAGEPDGADYERVTSIEPAGERMTYDLQVDDDVHNFVANGVVSHNTMLEDADMMWQLKKAQDRNLIMVDVGQMDEVEAQERLNRWQKKFRGPEFIDPASPKYAKQYKPWGMLQDIFMGVRGETDTSRVEQLPGSSTQLSPDMKDYYRNKLFGVAKIPKAYLGFEGEIDCFRLDTMIPCLDGKSRTLGEIIEKFETTGWSPYVYSWDEVSGKIVPGRVTWAGRRVKPSQQVEVTLDDGSKHVCTNDHRWYLLDGRQLEAGKLESGMQLLPLRRKLIDAKSYHGYERLYDPYGGSELTHLRVADTAWPGMRATMVDPDVHHRRGKRNNDPRRLQVLESQEHCDIHGIDRVRTLRRYMKRHGPWNKGVTKHSGDPRAAGLRQTTYVDGKCLTCGEPFTVCMMRRRKKFCSSTCAGAYGAAGRVETGRVLTQCQQCKGTFSATRSRLDGGKDRYCSRACHAAACKEARSKPCGYCGNTFDPGSKPQREFCSKTCSNLSRNKQRSGLIPLPNHTVVSVRVLDDVYETGDITVEGYHNFFVGDASTGGVLVHNSKATLLMQDVRFSRTMKRLRRCLIYGIRQTLDIHYSLCVNEDDDASKYDIERNPYTVMMPPISYLDEWERLELVQLRYTLIEQMAGLGQAMQVNPEAWTTYILLHYAKLPEDVVRLLTKKSDSAPPMAGPPGGGGNGMFGGAESNGEDHDRNLTTLVEKKFGKRLRGPHRWVGFAELSDAEKSKIHEAIDRSPKLRLLIEGVRNYHDDDDADNPGERQTDPSVLPPRTVDGVSITLSDGVADDAEARILLEDRQRLKEEVAQGANLTEENSDAPDEHG